MAHKARLGLMATSAGANAMAAAASDAAAAEALPIVRCEGEPFSSCLSADNETHVQVVQVFFVLSWRDTWRELCALDGVVTQARSMPTTSMQLQLHALSCCSLLFCSNPFRSAILHSALARLPRQASTQPAAVPAKPAQNGASEAAGLASNAASGALPSADAAPPLAGAIMQAVWTDRPDNWQRMRRSAIVWRLAS